jgi:hypothetical protein
MINQPEPVYSFTIPYYTTPNGDTDEIFVSEKTYEKYLMTMKKENTVFIHGLLHPLSSDYGDVTTTLFDQKKAIVVIGTLDLKEYTNELLDIAIAQELEKVLLLNKDEFFHFLYSDATPDTIQIFIDDIQQTLTEIHIAKRLKKENYRIYEREALLAKELLASAFHFDAIRGVSPYENEHALYILTKMIYLAYVDDGLFQQYKKKLKPHYPALLNEVQLLLKMIKKLNLSTTKGRERALMKIFKTLKYEKYLKKIDINDIRAFSLEIDSLG